MRAAPGSSGTQDAFPNYFPPNKYLGGSMKDYARFVQAIHQSENLLLPRTSLYYWVDKSDVDQDGGLHEMAIRRVNGLPRSAKWGRAGILVSPSSKRANQYLHQFFRFIAF